MRRFSILCATVVLAASLGVVMSRAGASSDSTTRAVPCIGAPVVRPGRFVLACGDGNFYVTSLHWVRWSASVGIATAIVTLNDCTPNCAEGHYHSTPGVFVFSDPVSRPDLGELFSTATVLDSTRLPGSNGTVVVQQLGLRVIH